MDKKLYQVLASLLHAVANCEKAGNVEWAARHRATLAEICADYLPSGSGFDNGTKLDETSTSERLVFTTGFHHMNSHGNYDGWTDHRICVRPSLESEFRLHIGGKNRNDIKEYISQTFEQVLNETVSY